MNERRRCGAHLFGGVGALQAPPGGGAGGGPDSSGRDELRAVDPLAGLDEQLLLLAAEDADPNDLGGAQRHLAPAARAAADAAVVADVPDAVGELGLEADLAGGLQLGAQLALLGAPLADGRLQQLHFVLLLPAVREGEGEGEEKGAQEMRWSKPRPLLCKQGTLKFVTDREREKLL